jgi:hypothetical protein
VVLGGGTPVNSDLPCRLLNSDPHILVLRVLIPGGTQNISNSAYKHGWPSYFIIVGIRKNVGVKGVQICFRKPA